MKVCHEKDHHAGEKNQTLVALSIHFWIISAREGRDNGRTNATGIAGKQQDHAVRSWHRYQAIDWQCHYKPLKEYTWITEDDSSSFKGNVSEATNDIYAFSCTSLPEQYTAIWHLPWMPTPS